MKRLLGVGILSLPFLGIITVSAIKFGFLNTLIPITIVIAIVACILVGVYLIYEGR